MLALFAVVTLFPIVWVVLLSLKSLPDAKQNESWPTVVDFGNYGYPLRKISTLTQNYWNGVFVTGSTVVISIVSAVLAVHALGKV